MGCHRPESSPSLDEDKTAKRWLPARRVGYRRVLLWCALGAIVSLDGGTASASLLSSYTLQCSGCHGAQGAGVPDKGIPDLAEAGLYAGTPEGRAYLVQVPGIAQSRLDDAAAARMLDYVLTRFSAAHLPAGFRPFTAAEVGLLRAHKATDASRRRQDLLAGLVGGQAAHRGK